jgi:hypothetical protein
MTCRWRARPNDELARRALRDVIERASAECGLTPTGHKFVVYSSRDRSSLGPGEVGALDALEADIEEWTPPADLAAGRRCRVQADGVEVAGVPIGATAFVHAVVSARVASYEAVHERVRLLQCVQSAFVILRVSLAARMVYVPGARVWTCDCAARKDHKGNRLRLRRMMSKCGARCRLFCSAHGTLRRGGLRGSLTLRLRCSLRPRSRARWVDSGLCA